MTVRQIQPDHTYRGIDGSRRRVLSMCHRRNGRGWFSHLEFRSVMTTGGMKVSRFAEWAVSDVTATEPLPPLRKTTYPKQLPCRKVA